MTPSCDNDAYCANSTITEQQGLETNISRIMEEKPGVSQCCEGSTCGCDDNCLDELALAFCTEDDGHIHPFDAHDEADDDCATCCNSDLQRSNEFPKASLDHPSDIDKSGSTFVAEPRVCSHAALRKRSVKHAERTGTKINVPKEACKQHKSIALNRYTETLAAFGCICKALLARGLQSCCTTAHSHTPRVGSRLSHRPAHSRTSITSEKRQSLDSCCGKSSCGRPVAASVLYQKSKSNLSVSSCCSGSCCGKDTASGVASKPGGDGRAAVQSVCGGSCCGGSNSDLDPMNVEEKVYSHGLEAGVLEKGLSVSQRAVLAVRGMTCTGCENKLIRTLGAIPSICNVKTSLVLARAEFDYSGDASELALLIQTIEKRTGFKAEEIKLTSTRSLELLVDNSLREKFLLFSKPDGVQDVLSINKLTFRVIYDPKVIGARDIMILYATFSPSLAPEPRDPAITAGVKHIRSLATRMIASAVLTIPVLIMTWAPLPAHPQAYAIVSLILASIVQIVITGPFYFSAFKSLFFSHLVETDLLIVLSTTAAYVYSVVAFAYEMSGHPLPTGEFFETSTLLVTLIMVGQLVSAFARQRAMEAISLRSLQQTHAVLVHPDGKEENIDARLLQHGDSFRVPPDSSIITDGIVRVGHSEVDESIMTGESLPVEKCIDSSVIAGTTNGPGTLVVELTRLPGENTLSDVAQMVDDARFSRAKVQATIDRVCTWFVPIVLSLAITTFVVWLAVGMTIRGQDAGQAAVTALTYAIAVLAVSCPCAIGLAVPMVVLVAGGVAAKKGVIFKAATTIEGARKITHVVFDKTGTLTEGRLAVVKSEVLEYQSDSGIVIDSRAVIMALTTLSRHPVACGVSKYLGGTQQEASAHVQNVELVTGKGILASLHGGILLGGSASWLELEQHPMVAPLIASGLTIFCVTYNTHLLGVFGLSDELRPETRGVVAALRQRGVGISVLSGDHPAAVCAVADTLDIPRERVRASCSPAEKQVYVAQLGNQGERVMFCGDGANDAVALAQADIGVHVHSEEGGAGVGAAGGAADVVLAKASLSGVLTLLELSDAVWRRIVLNFTWSAVYNLVAILFAAGAFVNARIAPAYAGLGEVVSVLPVVLVALQLKWFK